MKKSGYICFIRHGQTDWNTKGLMQGIEEIPLNQTGIEQADDASIKLSKSVEKIDFKFDKIISSPLSRASVTAEKIAKALNIDSVDIDRRLIERDFGLLSGSHYDKYSKAVLTDSEEKSVETVESLLKRVNSLILEKADKNKNVIFLTHGAVSRIFARNAKRLNEEKEIELGMLGNCHMVVYKYDGIEPRLCGYNISPDSFDKFILENSEDK